MKNFSQKPFWVVPIFVFCLGFSIHIKSQEYYQGVGGQGIIGISDYLYRNASTLDTSYGGGAYGIFGFYYQASLVFDAGFDNQLAISAYPFVGLSLNSVGYEIPLLAEFYFGEIDDYNFHFGAGYTYCQIFDYGTNNILFGPLFEVGGMFPFRMETMGLKLNFAFDPDIKDRTKELSTIGGFHYRMGISAYMMF